MLTVLCSGKGSPGVTSSALALASAWPSPAILVEADAGGGDLAIRLRTAAGQALPETPTVATLAAEVRADSRDPQLMGRRAVAINDHVSVLPGFASAEQGAGMAPLWDALARVLATSTSDVIADVGRIHSGSPTMRLAESADVVVVVARANLNSVVHLRTRITNLASTLGRTRGRQPVIVPLLITRARNAAADVADVDEVLKAAAAHTPRPSYLGWDPAALTRLEDGENPNRQLNRTTLMRSARQVADQLLVHRRAATPSEVVR